MISLPHRTVFVHIPKCGGQSIEAAFCEDLGLDWNRHRHLLLMFERPENGSWGGSVNRLAHLPARDYVHHDYLPGRLWDTFFTFSTVRNPFARLESLYFYSRANKRADFAAFVNRMVPRRVANEMYRPQSTFLTDPDGKVLVSRIYRLETLSRDWADIRQRAGLSTDLPHKNRSTRAPLEWTDPMRDIVREVYADDFTLLAYDPETGAALGDALPSGTGSAMAGAPSHRPG
ncbi:sulfotransferase family 2 domain-containing protein [Tropicimonas aquimaris]|uniref:Sulfotransferase family 2 domain-containing protein n=1 Tax=Tropicimonas aquimaris TaxID=914152 RepID=A0ABW3IQ23_9RHOB